MPWTGAEFAEKHNHRLKGKTATKAAAIATAMVRRGAPEGEAIATANKRAAILNHPSSRKERKA